MTANTQIESLADLIAYIVQAIVDNPEKVKISEITGSQSAVFELRVDKSDMGKVIGKKGRNINAIRTILKCASANANRRSTLEVIE